jgi:hypothetical protein
MDHVFKEFISLFSILILVLIQLGIILAAKISGWSYLSNYFKDSNSSYVNYRSFQSMRMGWCNYSGCMNFAISPEGLHMKVFFLFSAGHPPMLLPWNIFKDVKKPFWSIFLGHTFYIEYQGKKIKLRLPKALSEDILEQGYVSAKAN